MNNRIKYWKSALTKPAKNKLHAQKCELHGEKFDSQAERRRYMILSDWQRRGEISNLRRQVRYILIDPHRRSDGKLERAAHYVADFVYTRNGELVVEDVKGCRSGATYQVFALKRKLMLDRYGIEVQEIHV